MAMAFAPLEGKLDGEEVRKELLREVSARGMVRGDEMLRRFGMRNAQAVKAAIDKLMIEKIEGLVIRGKLTSDKYSVFDVQLGAAPGMREQLRKVAEG